MALENLTPVTRLETILDGGDITPVTRREYFLQKAAEGGGSGGSLPEYTSADKGKGLFLVKEGEGTTVTVVPEQTVTTDAGGNATLTGVDFSGLTDGQDVTIEATVGGETLLVQATYRSADGGGIYVTGHELPFITSEGDFTFEPSTTVTVSVTASVFSVAPAWVAPTGIKYFTNSNYKFDGLTVKDAKNMLDNGIIPFTVAGIATVYEVKMLTQITSDADSYSVYFNFMDTATATGLSGYDRLPFMDVN